MKEKGDDGMGSDEGVEVKPIWEGEEVLKRLKKFARSEKETTKMKKLYHFWSSSLRLSVSPR